MKMIILSDTHHDVVAIEKILPIINSCDCLVHLGDCNDDIKRLGEKIKVKEIIKVKGNCDFLELVNPTEVIREIDGVKILFTHGHRFRVKDDLLELMLYAQEHECKYVFYGHTHEPKTDERYGINFINPGTLSSTSNWYGQSYCVVEIENGKIFSNIIFMG